MLGHALLRSAWMVSITWLLRSVWTVSITGLLRSVWTISITGLLRSAWTVSIRGLLRSISTACIVGAVCLRSSSRGASCFLSGRIAARMVCLMFLLSGGFGPSSAWR